MERIDWRSRDEKSEDLGEGLSLRRFDRGSDLEPMRVLLYPKLLKLWSSALARDIDDSLVVEDAAKYPFLEDRRVMIVSGIEDLAAIYLYRKIEYSGMVGLNVNICLVDQRFQGMGLMKKLIGASIVEINPRFLRLHTQNQHMAKAVRSFCPEGYLYPFDGILERKMAQSFGVSVFYDPKLMVDKGLYGNGSPLYGDRAEKSCSDPAISEFFRQYVDFQAGDSVSVVGFLPESE